MSPAVFMLILVAAIVLLMVLIIKVKLHPVFALFTVALLSGITIGFGPLDTIVKINDGFANTLKGVGISIILGSVLAMGIQDTGAAKSISNFFIKLFRGKNLELAPSLTAFIVSIPVFGDITMVLTAPIASAIAVRRKISMSTMGSFTGLGLFLTHALVPPTPGILAIAIMFNADLGMTIVWGTIVSAIAFFSTWLILKKWVAKEWIEPNPNFVRGIEPAKSDKVEDILIKAVGVPNVVLSLLPVLIPVILIAASSFATMYLPDENIIRTICNILGDKIMALTIAVIYSMWLGYKFKKNVIQSHQSVTGDTKSNIREILCDKWVSRGLIIALAALLITAMGGAMGNVLKSAPAIKGLSDIVTSSPVPPILIPYLVGAIMMVAVGSMTTAGMTAAAIILPMLGGLGLSPIVATLAIGAGTMMGNHVNNSGFWVMGQFFNLNTKQGLKYITVPCAVASVVCIVCLSVFNILGFI